MKSHAPATTVATPPAGETATPARERSSGTSPWVWVIVAAAILPMLLAGWYVLRRNRR